MLRLRVSFFDTGPRPGPTFWGKKTNLKADMPQVREMENATLKKLSRSVRCNGEKSIVPLCAPRFLPMFDRSIWWDVCIVRLPLCRSIECCFSVWNGFSSLQKLASQAVILRGFSIPEIGQCILADQPANRNKKKLVVTLISRIFAVYGGLYPHILNTAVVLHMKAKEICLNDAKMKNCMRDNVGSHRIDHVV